jgi:hypothetical protein
MHSATRYAGVRSSNIPSHNAVGHGTELWLWRRHYGKQCLRHSWEKAQRDFTTVQRTEGGPLSNIELPVTVVHSQPCTKMTLRRLETPRRVRQEGPCGEAGIGSRESRAAA